MRHTQISDKKRVVIIGAGIVGVAAAIWLQRDGHKVVLVDKEGPAAGTSYGNGGVLVSSGIIPVNSPGLIKSAPGMLLRADSPLFLRWPYLPKMLPWVLRYMRRANPRDARRVATALKPILHNSPQEHLALARGTGAQKWIELSDYIFIYANRERFEKDKFAWSVRHEMGFTWDEMDSKTFDSYDPILKGSEKFAVRLSEHGHITDPGKYISELAAHVANQGGEVLIAEVQDIIQEQGRVTAVKTNTGLIQCDALVLAAGVWSKALAKKMGIDVPLESERGYHIELINPSHMPKSPLMLVSGKFVATPMDGRLRCAGIVEFGGLNAPASKAPFELLIRQIHQAIPSLRYDRIERWMGHRPAPVDSIPLIGSFEKIQGAYAAFGHHHVGLAGGPKTGRLIADMIADRKSDLDLAPYRLSRFT